MFSISLHSKSQEGSPQNDSIPLKTTQSYPKRAQSHLKMACSHLKKTQFHAKITRFYSLQGEMGLKGDWDPDLERWDQDCVGLALWVVF